MVGRPENLSGHRVSAVKPTCPISPTPCHCATPFPAAFHRQYTHHETGINPNSMHTSDVETEGVEGESPAPGRFVLRRDSDEDLAPSRDSAMSIRISDDSMAGAPEIDEVVKKT